MESQKIVERVDRQKLIESLNAALNNNKVEEYLELVESLVDKRVKFLVYDLPLDMDGFTALHVMAQNKADPKYVEKLIQEGADVKAKMVHGETPIHYAASYANKASLDCFFKDQKADEKKFALVFSLQE